MSLPLEAAAELLSAAMRDAVRKYSLWYLVEGILLVLAGVLAIAFSAISSEAVVTALGWLLIASGLVQAISLIGAAKVPHFWLQLVSVVLAVLVGLLVLRDPLRRC